MTQSSLTCGATEIGLSGWSRRSARSYCGRNFFAACTDGTLTMCWEWVRKAPSIANPIGILTLLSSAIRSEEHTSELQSQSNLVCRLLLEKKKKKKDNVLNRYK